MAATAVYLRIAFQPVDKFQGRAWPAGLSAGERARRDSPGSRSAGPGPLPAKAKRRASPPLPIVAPPRRETRAVYRTSVRALETYLCVGVPLRAETSSPARPASATWRTFGRNRGDRLARRTPRTFPLPARGCDRS